MVVLAFVLLLIGAFIGACSGSVGGGVKSWRVMIMLNHAYSNIVKMIHPNSVVTLRLELKAWMMCCNFCLGVLFYICNIICYFAYGCIISGLDLETAFSAVELV